MSYDDHDKPTEELVETFLANNTLEMSQGLETLNTFLGAAGYEQERYAGAAIGPPIEDFFRDNPGAIEAVIRWAGNNVIDGDDELRQNLIDVLPPACPECGYEVEAVGDVCDDCTAVDAEEAVEV